NGTLVYHMGNAPLGSTSGNARDLVAVDRAGKERELGLNERPMHSPRVSPDGNQVAMAIARLVDEPSRFPDIYRFDLRTRQAPQRVTTDSSSTVAAWLHDGNSIASDKRRNQGTDGADSAITIRPLYSAGRS